MAVISHCERAESYCLGLAGELNIYSAMALRQELLQALEPLQRLELDLSAIEDFDIAGVQLLLVLKREAARQNKPVRFVQHSPVVFEVLELLNLLDELGDSTPLTLSHEEISQ